MTPCNNVTVTTYRDGIIAHHNVMCKAGTNKSASVVGRHTDSRVKKIRLADSGIAFAIVVMFLTHKKPLKLFTVRPDSQAATNLKHPSFLLQFLFEERSSVHSVPLK